MPDRPPNVVLFISDQQRWDTIAAGGVPDIQTPHLDWLAGDGVLFRRAYCAFPICGPSRMAMLSGLYPHTNGMVANQQMRPGCDLMRYPEGVRNLGNYLGDLGYRMGYAGKWHLGSGAGRPGFDDLWTGGADYDVDHEGQNQILRLSRQIGVDIKGKQTGIDPDPATFDPATRVGKSLLPLAHFPSFVDMDYATTWVRGLASDDRPFGLVYSCHEPHPPFTSPEPFQSQYQPADMGVPATRGDPHGPAMVRRRSAEQLRIVDELDDDQMRAIRAGYWGATSYVDHLVGRLITALLESGKWDNTLFIFTSDHGEMLGHHDLLMKGAVMYEDLTRIPLIVRPPGGLGAMQTTDRVVSQVDLVPSILRMCGAEPADVLQGRDIGDLMRGEDREINAGVVCEFHSVNWTDPLVPLRMWVTEQWKYVASLDGTDELYDLVNDPAELTNLIDDPGHEDDLAAAKRGLERWLLETGDTWPDVVQPPPRPAQLSTV